MTLKEAAEKVLAAVSRIPTGGGWYTKDFPERDRALDALREALAAHDERERLRDAVIEAAQEWRKSGGAERFQSSIMACGRLADAVDALDQREAAERPRYEVVHECVGWTVRTNRDGVCSDKAQFYGPDAERHAKEWAERMKKERAE